MTDTTLPVRVPTIVDDDMDFTVVATNPGEMQKAQQSLILWCARKIEHVKVALSDVQEQYDIAVRAGWKTSAWERQIKRAENRVEFYRKIKAALEAGYYIVPPFPIDVFAIKTNRTNPDPKRSLGWHGNHKQTARQLPIGEGEYLAANPEVYYREIDMPTKDGKTEKKKEFFAKRFLPVDFPFKLAKPAVLSETAKAMALKVFDQFGVLPAYSAPDPIVCGQILYPEPSRYGQHRALTFFVAWWLDTRTL